MRRGATFAVIGFLLGFFSTGCASTPRVQTRFAPADVSEELLGVELADSTTLEHESGVRLWVSPDSPVWAGTVLDEHGAQITETTLGELVEGCQLTPSGSIIGPSCRLRRATWISFGAVPEPDDSEHDVALIAGIVMLGAVVTGGFVCAELCEDPTNTIAGVGATVLTVSGLLYLLVRGWEDYRVPMH